MNKISEAKYRYFLENENYKNIHSYFPSSEYNSFFSLREEAYCRIEIDAKINSIWIHGLFSKKKGSGKELMKLILTSHSYLTIRINCIGTDLRSYYEQFGFVVYFEHKSNCGEKYYEMILLSQ
jgi:hypothetical protein